MGFIAFLIPFIAFYSPALLFEGSLPSTLFVTLSTVLVLISISHAFSGHGFKRRLSWPERFVFLAAAGLLIVPHNGMTFGAGCLVLAGALALERIMKRGGPQDATV